MFDLLASAVDSLLRSFVTFGLIEHIVHRQYMYRVHFGLIYRKPFPKPLNAPHVSISMYRCNGKQFNSSHYRPCPFSKTTNNSHLSLSSFASCPNSLSNNRQTRMIASIDELVGYSKLSEWTRPTCGAFLTSPQIELLASAVDNLLRFFVKMYVENMVP